MFVVEISDNELLFDDISRNENEIKKNSIKSLFLSESLLCQKGKCTDKVRSMV